jgi:hypothetical protein
MLFGGIEYSLLRWGIPREPVWINGLDVTSPVANTDLITKTITGTTGRIFGYCIFAGEVNVFRLIVTRAGKTVFSGIIGGGVSTLVFVSPLQLGPDLKQGDIVSIQNDNAAGASIIYRADILYDED